MPPNLTDPPVLIFLSTLITTIATLFKLLLDERKRTIEQYEIRIKGLQERLELEERENERWQQLTLRLAGVMEESVPVLRESVLRKKGGA